jgi:glutamine synthetase
VLVGSCEFQLGPLTIPDVGDEMWMARYIAARVAECFGLSLSYDPKPVEGMDGCGASRVRRGVGSRGHLFP